MSTCPCCIVYDTQVLEGNAILTGVNTISLDMNLNFDWWDETDNECNPYSTRMDLLGPTIGTFNLTAYPFSNESTDPYAHTMDFSCPVEISVEMGYKYIFDCSECVDCVDPITGEIKGRRRGKWLAIPNKKKQIKVTGDVSGVSSTLMEFGDQLYKINKLNLQAGQQPFIIPPVTYLYKTFKYNGSPLIVDTTNDWIYELQVSSDKTCQGLFGTPVIEAFLTSFSFRFEPPNPVTVQYNFNWYMWLCS